MYFTGFADEAAPDIDGQIRAIQELGWNQIESRSIDGKNLHDIPEDKFNEVADKLDAAGIHVNCFGSAIGNWGHPITDPFEITLEEVKRAIPRMHRLDSHLIRIMSYKPILENGPQDQMKEERFRRLSIITKMFLDEGIQPVHENCTNYGGLGWPFTIELVENVPGLKLVFDTGNPVFDDDWTKPKPYPKEDSWEFYENVKEHVVYVHIKDGHFDKELSKMKFTYPGEGDGYVEKIVRDLIVNRGYDGGFSMEPHMGMIYHEQDARQASPEEKFQIFVEYGRRFEAIIRKIKGE
ncbi:MAG: sugar phosphate isomerase/epimerase [Victivallales bacterium]|nr:sugar phosphate isomerase/epimerase [Victivallales bacterium]